MYYLNFYYCFIYIHFWEGYLTFCKNLPIRTRWPSAVGDFLVLPLAPDERFGSPQNRNMTGFQIQLSTMKLLLVYLQRARRCNEAAELLSVGPRCSAAERETLKAEKNRKGPTECSRAGGVGETLNVSAKWLKLRQIIIGVEHYCIRCQAVKYQLIVIKTDFTQQLDVYIWVVIYRQHRCIFETKVAMLVEERGPTVDLQSF